MSLSEASPDDRSDDGLRGDRNRDAAQGSGGARVPGRRELLVAFLVALLLAAWPVRHALFDLDRVFFAVDTATVQLPWSPHLPEEARSGPTNPDLSDQGIVFYPFYRWVSRSWRAADPPTWCPLIYAGAPGFGNAQSGALDPQVLLLVLLDAVGGERLFDWGLGLTAWLRIAFALTGAFALARRLGLMRAPAALAAVTFGFSGYLTLWLNHPLGHVPPLLPWVLFFLEGIRLEGKRLEEGRGGRPYLSIFAVAVCLALAILGGHAETAFFVGATGGLWALAIARTDRVAGLQGLFALALGSLACLVSLLPLIEYLGLSAAQVVREGAAERLSTRPDLLALGILLVLAGLCVGFVRPLSRARLEGFRVSPGVWLPAAFGLLFAVGGGVLVLQARGLDPAAALALVPDRLGAPGDHLGGFRGDGNYIEAASPWVAFAALAFAFAAVLSPAGPLLRRRLLLALAVIGFLLALRMPGLLELWRLVPVVGLGDTIRLMSVASLAIGLLAGEALQAAPRASRLTAAAPLALLVGATLLPDRLESLDPSIPVEAVGDELCDFVALPASRIDGEDSSFEGWLHPELNVAGARLVVDPIDASGVARGEGRVVLPLEIHASPSSLARPHLGEAPPLARWFRTPYLLTSALADGHYRLTLEFLDASAPSEVSAHRLAGVFTVQRSIHRHPVTLLCIAISLIFLVLHPLGASGLVSWCVVALVLLQGLHFGRGVNSAVPRGAAFPLTRTEEILAEGLGPHRFLTDPGILPADTGLVRGLSHIEGYDAMDVHAFNEYRTQVLPPGVSPLLAWNARGVDPTLPTFRLFGVGMFAMREPFEHPEWELVAGPREEGERWAETWIYRARDPYPRAFCVGEVISLEELAKRWEENPRGWNPLETAALQEEWRPASPFTRATVGVPRWTNSTVRVDAELDGDGLLLLTDQVFPGWKVFVDGEERELFTANMIFRAVALEAGRHEIEFRYDPLSIRLGAWISGLAGLGILALLLLGLRPSRATVA
jgi:hypothetical protein